MTTEAYWDVFARGAVAVALLLAFGWGCFQQGLAFARKLRRFDIEPQAWADDLGHPRHVKAAEPDEECDEAPRGHVVRFEPS